MDDEKMIRAVLAGHALQGLIAGRVMIPAGHGAPQMFLAAEAVRLADALLVELKKDSAVPAPESAPPLANDAGTAEVVQDHQVGQLTDDNATRVFTHPCCEAYGCDRPGVHVFRFTPLSSGHFCAIHVYVRPESILLEWHGKAKKARAA